MESHKERLLQSLPLLKALELRTEVKLLPTARACGASQGNRYALLISDGVPHAAGSTDAGMDREVA